MKQFASTALFLAAFVAFCAVGLTIPATGQGKELEARALEAFRGRNFSMAELRFLELTQKHPAQAHYWKLLGMTYAAQEKYSLAVPAFSRACNLDIDEQSACYYLGRSYFTLGRLEQSLQAYRLALKSAGAFAGRIHAGLALAYEAMSRPTEAEKFYMQAIQEGETSARTDYGLFLFKNDRPTESLGVLRAAGATAEIEKVTKALAARSPETSVISSKAPITFERRTLPMVVRNGATGEKHLIETMIAGVAVFDYDNDGWADIYVANGATVPGLVKEDPTYFNRLFRNNGDGTFSDVTEKAGVAGQGYSMGVAAADFDNDGNTDLFVTGVRGIHLYRNRGDGTFADVTEQAGLSGTTAWSVAAGWFDFDNDGLLDLFVVNYVAWDPSREIFCGAVADTAFHLAGYRQYCHPSQYDPSANALYKNLGNGKFRDVSRESGIGEKFGKGMGVAFGDIDGDGRLDIFIANDTLPNLLFHNEGNGKFREVGVEAGVAYNGDGNTISGMGADFRDFDNDGREDIFVTALSNETFPLFRNKGGGYFADVTHPSGIGKAALPWTGWSTGMFDFNNDGLKDIFVASGHVMDNAELSSSRQTRQPNIVFVHKGSGKFEAQLLPEIGLHRGAAFGDFDHDGRIDAVVTRLNQEPLVLRNTTASANWIEFRLIGRKSNRDGIGAGLHVISASGDQWNRVTTSVGYGCSSDRVVHFGLGRDASVRSVEIRWPSGIIQTLRDLPVNRSVTIEEAGSP